MRKLFSLFAAAALVVGAAGQAHAAAATYLGSMAVQIGTLPPLSATGTGSAIVNGSAGGGHLSSLALGAGAFATTVTLPVTGAFPIAGLKANPSNGAGTFVEVSGLLGGVMPLQGVANICLFLTCGAPPPANVNVPFTIGGIQGVGIGGAPIIVTGLVNVTVTSGPWTMGTTAIGTSTAMGSAHGPLSNGLSSAAQTSGTVRLVTPVNISTNIAASAVIAAFGILDIHFTSVVPEPGTLLLLGAGVVGLAAIGRKRTSK